MRVESISSKQPDNRASRKAQVAASIATQQLEEDLLSSAATQAAAKKKENLEAEKVVFKK